jgi:hypothetical protein
VDLFIVGDDQASSIVHGRLKVEKPGPGYCHFPADGQGYDHEYFRQMTSMKAVIRYTKGRPRRDWVLLPGRRNEAFDARPRTDNGEPPRGWPRIQISRGHWERSRRLLALSRLPLQPDRA